MVQWSRLCTSTVGGTGTRETKVSHATRCGQKQQQQQQQNIKREALHLFMSQPFVFASLWPVRLYSFHISCCSLVIFLLIYRALCTSLLPWYKLQNFLPFSYWLGFCCVFFFFLINLFIYLFLAVLGLRCCTQASSSCGEQGLLFVAVCGLLIARLLLLRSMGSRRTGLSSCGSRAVVVAHGLSCSAACGIFLDKGSNPCPLNWQADS